MASEPRINPRCGRASAAGRAPSFLKTAACKFAFWRDLSTNDLVQSFPRSNRTLRLSIAVFLSAIAVGCTTAPPQTPSRPPVAQPPTTLPPPSKEATPDSLGEAIKDQAPATSGTKTPNSLKACLEIGGRWSATIAEEGVGKDWHCKAPDAGRKCAGSSECKSGFCVASKLVCANKVYEKPKGAGLPEDCELVGACHAEMGQPDGCVGLVVNGKLDTQCFKAKTPRVPRARRAAAQTIPKAELEWRAKAQALQNKQDWSGLLRLAQAWVKENPQSASAWQMEGVASFELNQYERAAQAYEKAVRIAPADTAAQVNLAIAYSRLDQADRAARVLEGTVRTDSQDAAAWTALGAVYMQGKEYDQAIRALNVAQEIDSSSGEIWYNLGAAHESLKQYPPAADAYREALRINPNDALALKRLGVVYAAQGERKRAAEVHQTLLKLDPHPAGELRK